MVTIKISQVTFDQKYFNFLHKFVRDYFLRYHFDTTQLFIDDTKVIEVYQDIDDNGGDTIFTWFNKDYLDKFGITYGVKPDLSDILS